MCWCPRSSDPKDIKNHLVKIRQLEREGDEIYREATAHLFSGRLWRAVSHHDEGYL
jgi:uncharacterized protein Yka (UPF0111/DUF47 family)